MCQAVVEVVVVVVGAVSTQVHHHGLSLLLSAWSLHERLLMHVQPRRDDAAAAGEVVGGGTVCVR